MFDSKLSAALFWSAKGFRVFPIEEGTKDGHVIPNWVTAATTDPEQIRKWWARWPNANIGCLTTGHVVLDVDVKEGQHGLESLEGLRIDQSTLTVRTGSGGLHLYYAGPECGQWLNFLGPGSGLDIKAHNNYVLAPGSVINGKPYKVINDAEIELVPAVLDPFLRPPGTRRRGSKEYDDDSPEAIEQATHYLTYNAPVSVKGQGGNNTAFKVAAYLTRDLGLSEDTALALMLEHWNGRCVPPAWTERKLGAVVDHSNTYGRNEKGSASIGRILDDIDLSGIEDIIAEGPDAEAPKPGSSRSGAWKGPRPLSAREISEGIFPPAEWLIPNLILEGQVNLLYGDGGIGKTMLALQEAVCIASGKPMFGRSVKQRPVLLVLAEDDNGETKKRLGCICEHLGVDLSNLDLLRLWCLPGHDIRIARADNLGEVIFLPFYHALRQELLTMPGGFLVLDSLADVGSMDEANREAVNAYLKRVVGKLCIDCKVTVEVLGHPSKAAMQDGSGYSGGTAFNAAVRHRKYLGRHKDAESKAESKKDPRRVYEVAKTNYGVHESLNLWFHGGAYRTSEDAGAVKQQEETDKLIVRTALKIIDGGNTIVRSHGNGLTPRDVAQQVKREHGITVSPKDVLAALNAATIAGILEYCRGRSHGNAGFQRSLANPLYARTVPYGEIVAGNSLISPQLEESPKSGISN